MKEAICFNIHVVIWSVVFTSVLTCCCFFPPYLCVWIKLQTGGQKGGTFSGSLKKTPECGTSPGTLWRRSFDRHRWSSGKPTQEGKAMLRSQRSMWRIFLRACWLQPGAVGYPGILGTLHLTYCVLGHAKSFSGVDIGMQILRSGGEYLTLTLDIVERC